MARATILTGRLGLRHPVIQAPLAGGGDTPALVAAVCEAGALGFIGASYLTPRRSPRRRRRCAPRRAAPSAINLFAPLPAPEAPREPGRALERLEPFYAELALPRPELPTLAADSFAEQLAAALESGASVFSFTFGRPAGGGAGGDQGAGHVRDRDRDDRGGGGRAGEGGSGCHRHARQRSGRASGHLRGRLRGGAGGHDGARAAGRGRGERARDRVRRDHGRPRDRGGPRPRRKRGTDGHGLSDLPRGRDPGCVQGGDPRGARGRDASDAGLLGPPGPRDREPLHDRDRPHAARPSCPSRSRTRSRGRCGARRPGKAARSSCRSGPARPSGWPAGNPPRTSSRGWRRRPRRPSAD